MIENKLLFKKQIKWNFFLNNRKSMVDSNLIYFPLSFSLSLLLLFNVIQMENPQKGKELMKFLDWFRCWVSIVCIRVHVYVWVCVLFLLEIKLKCEIENIKERWKTNFIFMMMHFHHFEPIDLGLLTRPFTHQTVICIQLEMLIQDSCSLNCAYKSNWSRWWKGCQE